MTPECARVMDSLGGPLPEELAAHVASCEACRALTGGFDALGPPPPPPAPSLPPALKAPALAELASHPRPSPWWRELAVLGAVYAAVTGVSLGFTPLGRLLNRAPEAVVVGLAALLLALMAGGAVLALAPRRRDGGGRGLVVTSAAVVALAVALGGSGQDVKGLLAGCIGCTSTHLTLSALPLVAALALLRRSAYHPVRALAAGLSAGAVGLFVLHLHCPNGSAMHLGLSHVAPWLLVGGLAVWARSRLGSHSYAP